LSWATSSGNNPGLQPYKYNGKEFVEMHGYDKYDYGVRGMYPAIMRFSTPDPLAEKYYSISPYAYCGNNPVRFVDPDGKKILYAASASKEFKKNFAQSVQYLNTHKAAGMLYQLEKSESIYYITETNGGSFYNSGTNTISWDPTKALLTNEGHELSPTTVLNHEIDHALQDDKSPEQQEKDRKTPDARYGNKEEKRVIEGSEQETAKKLGEIKEKEVTRKDHGGTLYQTISPTSIQWKNPIVIKPKKDEKNN